MMVSFLGLSRDQYALRRTQFHNPGEHNVFVWLLATQGSNSCVCIVLDRSEPLLFTNAPTTPVESFSTGVSEPSLNETFYRDLPGRWAVSQ